MPFHLAGDYRPRGDQPSAIDQLYRGILDGDRDQAIAFLQKAVANHGIEFPYAIRDPLFDPLRSDPRYVDLMRSAGLPPQ